MDRSSSTASSSKCCASSTTSNAGLGAHNRRWAIILDMVLLRFSSHRYPLMISSIARSASSIDRWDLLASQTQTPPDSRAYRPIVVVFPTPAPPYTTAMDGRLRA